MKKFWLFTSALLLSSGVIFAQHPFFDAGSSYEGSEDINTTEPAIGYFIQLPDIDKINEDKPFVVGAEMIYSTNSKIITLPLSYYVITENKTIYAFKLMLPYVMRKISFKFDPSQEFSGSGIGDITIGADMYTKLGEMPVFAQLLVKTPTGKVDNESKENEFAYIPLGTGTWDFALSVGLTKYIDNVTLKGKVGYRINGTYEYTHADTIKQEYNFGNMMNATMSVGMPLTDVLYSQITMSYVNNGKVQLTNTYLTTDTINELEINGTAISTFDITPQLDYEIKGFVFSAGVIIPVYSAWGDPKPEEMVPGEGIPDPERAIKIKFGFQHPF